MSRRRMRAAHGTIGGTSLAVSVDGTAGFSVVELLIALSVLIFTLIALMGLATTSSFLVSSSRQRSAMVNAAASYLERVRQEPYANVGTPGGDPAGDLVTQVSTSTPYVVTITPHVSWGRPEDPANRALKTVTLSISSASVSGGSVMAFTAGTLLADIGSVGAPASSGVPTPSVALVSPADGSVVWGSVVTVTTSGTAGSASRTLALMDVMDGVQSWGATTVTGVSAQHIWTWNTTSAREGRHKLTPRVTDSGGTTASGSSVTLTVDNVAPSVPGGAAGAFSSGSNCSVWWDASTDGTDVDGTTALPASHYLASAYRQPTSATLAANYTAWAPVTGVTGLSVTVPPTSASPLAVSGLSGFSRYCVAVSASSPDRGAASGLVSAATTVVGVTKGTAAGTWTVTRSGGTYTVNVSLGVPSGPTFPWVGTATTKFYRLTSPSQSISSGTLLGTVSSTYPTWSTGVVTDSRATNSQPAAYWYAAVTTLTPSGYGSASTTVGSSVLGPPPDMTTTGTRDLVFTQW
jgi:type II secretory pathway pseudopilin PulG